MYLDKVTEAIAHFVGLFQIATEQNRIRDDYLEFRALKAKAETPPPDGHAGISFQNPYDLDDPQPGLHFVPSAAAIEPFLPQGMAAHALPDIPPPIGIQSVAYPGYIQPLPDLAPALSSIRIVEPALTPPGSVAVHAGQTNMLSDSDFVSVNVSAANFETIGTPNLALDALMQDASVLQPIPVLESLGSTADIGSFIVNTATSLNNFVAALQATEEQGGHGGVSNTTTSSTDSDGTSVQAHVTVVENPTDSAIYVNGQVWTGDAPNLNDYLPAGSPLIKEAAQASTDPVPETGGQSGGGSFVLGSPATATSEEAHGQGVWSGDGSVTINTGSNALTNTALVVNDALEANVMAVAGNHYVLNAIVQINAWSDSASIGASMAGWSAAASSATKAFNIASMQQTAVPAAPTAAGGAEPDFPKAWAVTQITGDFVSLNWAQQFNFVIDNDKIVTAAQQGVTTTVGTGGNLAVNSMSLADLGKYFDLILVGGSYYGANIISQKNVLLNDDVIGAVSGFQTTGHGSISTGGNLLWNEADITRIGSETALTLPSAYHNALNDFAGGNKTLSADVLHDSAFQGLGGLRVLYISGNVYDLQYIQQTNILGDSDQVALALNSAHKATDANWSITTGANALVNVAHIVSVDPIAKTYYGGDHYSDELLVQTDIIKTDHLLQSANADHLVNEAVAFLSDDMLKPDHHPDPVASIKDNALPSTGHSDVLHTVIS
ncbi:hypothetical protein [Mesorhizobium sp. SP-1A]|uniref:hypothetical protein n=1 Tax=Mesorhizobium sp. SP-1A TaxID=3077840 RepID=UPI0028F6E2C6|nr:hypothetical protein [Mesorhizobium sp. SP-1A]